MKVLIIGSGISGLTTAIEIAKNGEKAILVSPMPSERAQSVMAAGGINASKEIDEDTIQSHIEDTLNGGVNLAGKKAVEGLCTDAVEILKWLEQLGVVFNRDENGNIARRAFGGQRFKRTAFSGSGTGKQIVTALVQEARKYEKDGRIERKLGYAFHSGLIQNKRCYGALFLDERSGRLTPIYADKTVMAVGGQNALFGKTTGSTLCDGYAAGKLFLQGATLKNLEFIQYHPTTIETPQKRMLITEAARGEGGRLYYMDGDKRVYFMEDAFGPKGNLMPRDVVSKCMFDTGKQVYLDLAFLGKEKIENRLKEVDELCSHYIQLDVRKKSIPVAPSVHFFMGGIAVDLHHRTDIADLYAVGECASMYHGANRLGGNSLLAAVHSGRVAAKDILSQAGNINTPPGNATRAGNVNTPPGNATRAGNIGAPTENLSQGENVNAPNFEAYIRNCEAQVEKISASKSRFSANGLLKSLAAVMNTDMGITRDEQRLAEGIKNVDYYLSVCEKLRFSPDLSPYDCFRVPALLTLSRAILTSAVARKETRGAHIREDYPEMRNDFAKCTLIRYNDGQYDITYESEDAICW